MKIRGSNGFAFLGCMNCEFYNMINDYSWRYRNHAECKENQISDLYVVCYVHAQTFNALIIIFDTGVTLF